MNHSGHISCAANDEKSVFLRSDKWLAYPIRPSKSFKDKLQEGWQFSLQRNNTAELEADQDLLSIGELRADLIASRGSEQLNIGYLSGVHITKCNGPWWMDMDDHSHELLQVLEVTHERLNNELEHRDEDEHIELREFVAGELSWHNHAMIGLVYISHVEINDGWRGGGLGLFAMEEILAEIHNLEPCQMIAVINVGVDAPKLVSHFRRMGFESVRGRAEGYTLEEISGYMVLDMELRRPDINELLPNLSLKRSFFVESEPSEEDTETEEAENDSEE